MSQMRFCYDDIITDSTVITFNSEEILLPVENIGNEILAKKYRTKTGFIIKSGYNDVFRFYESAGSSTVTDFALSATTFTGSGLASAIQTAMRANGKFSTQTVSYNSSTERFTITKASTATTMSLRFNNLDMSISEIMGYIKKDYASASTFISAPTKGNQQWVELRKENLSGSVFILHEHNFSSGTVLKLRAQATSTYFYGLNGYGFGNGVFEEYTNSIPDPVDLDQWIKTNCTIRDSRQTINGYKLWELNTTAGGSAAHAAKNNFTDLTGDSYFGVIVKYVNTDKVKIQINGLDPTDMVIRIEFSTKIITFSTVGSNLIDPIWFDDNTVIVFFAVPTAATGGSPVDVQLHIGDIGGSTVTDEKVLYSQPILVDDTTTAFPFVDGTHSADVIDETDTISAEQTYHLRFNPRFAFDKSGNPNVLTYWIDGTHYFRFRYISSIDKWRISFLDGGSVAHLDSQQFGTGFTNINQIIDFFISLKLHGADQTGSRFIIIPKDSGNLFEDSSWTATPDNLSSAFTTASIGWDGVSGEQINSEYEIVRKYEGLLVGTVTSLEDANTLLASMTKVLNLDYKHTDYMRYLSTSTTMGQFEQEITINADPDVTLLDETLQGNVIQLSWADIKKSYSEIGRAFLSPVFYPANHPDNKISWFKKKILRRSGKTMAESGATYFDKRDSVDQYTIIPDPLNEYRNPDTKTGMETFLDTVGDWQSFYIILDSDLSNTVYGFLPGNTDYNRLKNTPTIIIPPMILQEQK